MMAKSIAAQIAPRTQAWRGCETARERQNRPTEQTMTEPQKVELYDA
jgi:hypothetical protein